MLPSMLQFSCFVVLVNVISRPGRQIRFWIALQTAFLGGPFLGQWAKNPMGQKPFILLDLFSFYRNISVFSLISSMTEDKLDPFDHGGPTNEGKEDRLSILKRSTHFTILDPGLIP